MDAKKRRYRVARRDGAVRHRWIGGRLLRFRTMNMTTRIRSLLIALSLWPGLALADNLLSGEDAAYIDWSVNNCATKSTDKEHAMVDQANAKDAAEFLRKYMGKDLSGALATPTKQADMCADIKKWYGPNGSRIAGLISWENAPAAPSSDKPAADNATGKKGGRRRPSQ